MSSWDSLSKTELSDFREILRRWLDLRICSANALANHAGYNSMTVYRIRNSNGGTTHKTAGELMQAIGQIERAYIKQWRDRRVCYESH